MPKDKDTDRKRMTDAEYVAAGGLQCPFCRSTNVSGGDADLDGPAGTSEDECSDCGEAWTSRYGLVGYSHPPIRGRLHPEAAEDDAQADEVCDECGNEIPDVPDGDLDNRHHDPSCSLYNPDKN